MTQDIPPYGMENPDDATAEALVILCEIIDAHGHESIEVANFIALNRGLPQFLDLSLEVIRLEMAFARAQNPRQKIPFWRKFSGSYGEYIDRVADKHKWIDNFILIPVLVTFAAATLILTIPFHFPIACYGWWMGDPLYQKRSWKKTTHSLDFACP